MNLSMRATRVGPAAAQALQLILVVIFGLLPLFVPLWAIFSFAFAPAAARGLRNTDSTPGPRWLKWPLALVSLLFNDTGLLENATRFAKDALHLDEAKSLIARAAEKPRSYRAALRSFFRGEDETCDAGDCAE